MMQKKPIKNNRNSTINPKKVEINTSSSTKEDNELTTTQSLPRNKFRINRNIQARYYRWFCLLVFFVMSILVVINLASDKEVSGFSASVVLFEALFYVVIALPVVGAFFVKKDQRPT